MVAVVNFFQFLYEFITTTDLKQKEIEEKAQIILAKYSGDYSNLYNLIKYDEQCTMWCKYEYGTLRTAGAL